MTRGGWESSVILGARRLETRLELEQGEDGGVQPDFFELFSWETRRGLYKMRTLLSLSLLLLLYYVYMYIDTFMYIIKYTHTQTHACIHTYIHTYIHTCVHACIHTDIPTCMCRHTYTHTYHIDIFTCIDIHRLL